MTLVRFIRAYDFEAPIEDVAAYFGLEPADVAVALELYSRNFDRMHPLVMEGER